MNKLALFLFLLVFTACAAPSLEPFALTGTCQQSYSEARRSCREQGAGCLGDVEDVCGSSEYGCAEDSFRGHLGGYDAALEERCVEYMETCHTPADAVYCAQYAQIEDPSAIAAYECLVATACRPERCPVPTPDVTLAQSYLSSLDFCGWTSPAEEAQLAEWFGWLRDDVRASLRVCLAMSCGSGRVPCSNTWMDTVFP